MNARGDSVLTIAKIKCVIPKSLFVLLGVTDRAFSKKQEDPSHALVAEFCRHEITKAIAERDEYNSTIALAKFFLTTNIKSYADGYFSGIAYPSVESKARRAQ